MSKSPSVDRDSHPVNSTTCHTCGAIGGHTDDCGELNALWASPASRRRLALLARRIDDTVQPPLLAIDYLTEVVQTAEILIAQQVDQARDAGESWAAIAANLGTTKQAAQQRYGTKRVKRLADPGQLSIDDA